MAVARVDSKVMPGNIGYLKLDVIPTPEVLAPALDRAMKAVANTRALILDLRTNRGGSGDGMLYLGGYFFATPTIVAHLYSRDPDDTTIMRTADVGGPRHLDRPLYILTSHRTFSAGEAAAYHLKYSAHATTVGDTNGGGAHRMRSVDLNEDFMLLLPYTRVSNAVTHGDREGTGVVPDVAVPSATALATAYALALRRSHSGNLEERTLYDSSYQRERRIWIYTPPAYEVRRARPYPLIVAFDGAEYRDTMPLPAVLDSLFEAKRAPAFVAVLVDDSVGAVRIADLGNAHRMNDFLSRQLVPFVRSHWNVTRDAHRVIVTGSSAGGLGAAYVAFMRPDLFGNVWSQSGAFWRGAEASNDPPYEWLTAQVRAAPTKDIRFMLDVGALEDHATLGGAGPNFRQANRRLRDALKAKGYEITYTEVLNGNHGEHWWIPRLAVGIVNLSAAWPEERAK
jgi:enterochelin esterase-like enzyme